MPAEFFLDSSVLLYTLSRSDPRSQIALELVERGGCLSVQVLNEFVNVASRKLKLNWDAIEEALIEIRLLSEPPLALTLATHEMGIELARRYRYSVYDSMILASALESGAPVLYSEDMHNGQRIGSVTIRNPFLSVT